MKKSTKSALLSAFVFPGSGHLFLRRYVHGALLAGTAAIALYFLISITVRNALEVVEKIQLGEIQPDVTAILTLLSQQPIGSDTQLINLAKVVLIACWLIGVIDSYRMGRLKDGQP